MTQPAENGRGEPKRPRSYVAWGAGIAALLHLAAAGWIAWIGGESHMMYIIIDPHIIELESAMLGGSPYIRHWFYLLFGTASYFVIGGTLGLIVFGVREETHRVRADARRKRRQCAQCGYSLEGNVSGRCPECGEKFD